MRSSYCVYNIIHDCLLQVPELSASATLTLLIMPMFSELPADDKTAVLEHLVTNWETLRTDRVSDTIA
jgi:hypothetical protein